MKPYVLVLIFFTLIALVAAAPFTRIPLAAVAPGEGRPSADTKLIFFDDFNTGHLDRSK